MNTRKYLTGICLVVVLIVSVAQASSFIADGIIVSVNDKSLVLDSRHTPYSSVGSALKTMTRTDGKQQKKYFNMKNFLTYYLDEVPVTQEQMVAYLKPGMRVVMMENRSKMYFLYVSTRGQGNQIGNLKSFDPETGTVVLDREQMGSGGGGFTDYYKPLDAEKAIAENNIYPSQALYPNHEHSFTFEDDAVVLRKGETIPWREAALTPDSGRVVQRNSYLLQAVRPAMRVELIPPGYGDWHQLVNRDDLMHSKNHKNNNEVRNQFLVQAKGTGLEKRSVYVTPPAWVERKSNPAEKKQKNSNGFVGLRLAGRFVSGDYLGIEERDPVTYCPIYSKGQSIIVDGMYATQVRGWHDEKFVQPGRVMVAFQRRARVTPDRFAFSSEFPLAMGMVEAVDDNQVTVTTPKIEGAAFTGTNTVTIPKDATFHHLGLPANREEVLKVGQLLMIYPKRPQTLVVNAGL